MPIEGGTLTGNLNVNGILRVNDQQSIYDSGTMITLSTNNRQTMIAGSQVYSKTNVIVSSDERLKENIKHADPGQCINFVNNLDVKTFNYIGDKTPCMGVIAQDLQDSEFADFFVFTQPGEDKYLAVKASDLAFPLIAAVQNLSAEIDNLKAMIQQTNQQLSKKPHKTTQLSSITKQKDPKANCKADGSFLCFFYNTSN